MAVPPEDRRTGPDIEAPKGQVTFEWPGSVLPDGKPILPETRVFAVCYSEGASDPETVELKPNAGGFSATAELPAGSRYRYEILFELPDGQQISHSEPSMHGSVSEPDPMEEGRDAQEDEADGARVEAPREAIPITRGQAETRRAVAAVGEDDAEPSEVDLEALGERLHRAAQGLFEGGQAAIGDGKASKEYREALHEWRQILREATRVGGRRVVESLARDLSGGIGDLHKEWLEGNYELNDRQRESLGSPVGRLQFRVNSYNKLCDQGVLGLTVKDRIKSTLGKDEAKIAAHMKKHLGKEYVTFERICSNFDGGAMIVSLEAEGIKAMREVAHGSRFERFKLRKGAREKREKSILQRHKMSEKAFEPPPEIKWYTKALNEGGDVALKGAAVAAVVAAGTSALPIAAALWLGKGTYEAVRGKDFGLLVKDLAALGPKLLGRGAKLLRFLPESWKDKIMPSAFQRFIESPSSALFHSGASAKISGWDRAKTFARGFVPLPWLFDRAPYLKRGMSKVAQPEQKVGEAYTEQREEADSQIESACRTALAKIASPKTSESRSVFDRGRHHLAT